MKNLANKISIVLNFFLVTIVVSFLLNNYRSQGILTESTLPYFLLGIALIGFTIFYFLYFAYLIFVEPKKKSIELMKYRNNLLNANFEKDIEFLAYIVDFKVKNAIDMIIQPMELTHRKAFINDDIANVHIENITIEILSMLSDDYKQLMYKYFTEDSLVQYIAEIVFQAVNKAIININGKKIGDIYTSTKKRSQ